jgi:hypothetical protein
VKPGPIQVALQVADALETCGLPYLVGGSVASSFGGEPRTTLDVDIVVPMTEADVDRFLGALGSEFYADDAAIRRAIRQRSSANLIHQPSAIKVDLFIAGGSALDEQQLARRRRVQVSENPPRFLYVHTPEDILLQKLRWYRLGREASDRAALLGADAAHASEPPGSTSPLNRHRTTAKSVSRSLHAT